MVQEVFGIAVGAMLPYPLKYKNHQYLMRQFKDKWERMDQRLQEHGYTLRDKNIILEPTGAEMIRFNEFDAWVETQERSDEKDLKNVFYPPMQIIDEYLSLRGVHL